MDAVYGTKRYLRSLMSNGSDIYGTPNSRITHNEINNSYGYRSAINQSEMSKYPYYNEFSQNNQYGYNNWGMGWREHSIAPSVYSTKSRNEVKSFSIILSTAAFIVILAVISVAGLAFYFGTFKSNLDEPVMMFEGNFHIMKGDVYTTALKYNHSSTYKQKLDFYERFIEKSLRDHELQPVKVEILGFGDGPLINTIFRTFLDIRKIPINIRSVEEHIKEAILFQTTSPKSLYKSIRVDPDTFAVNRVLDDEKIKSALFIMSNSQDENSIQSRKSKPGLIKSPSPTLLTTARAKIVKASPNANTYEEHFNANTAPDDIVVPAVVSSSFEGSFEITKTDADITRKKTTPTKAVATKKTSQTTIRLKSKSKPTVEKIYKTPMNTTLSMLVKPAVIINDGLKSAVTRPVSTTTKTTTEQPTTSRQTTRVKTSYRARIVPTIPTKMTTMKPTTSSTASTTTTTTTVEPETTTSIKKIITTPYHNSLSEVSAMNDAISKDLNHTMIEIDLEPAQKREDFDPPKLDVHLFTTSPVLDTEPWRPIRPPIPTTQPFNVGLSSLQPSSSSEPIKPDFTSHLMNIKNATATATTKDTDLLFYHSFTNPVFMPGLSGIEKLGNSIVKAHPIPVQLLDDVVVPNFKPVDQKMNLLDKIIKPHDSLFEEIGGGVLLRKPNKPNKTHNSDVENQTSTMSPSTTTTKTSTTKANKDEVTENPFSPTKPITKVEKKPAVPIVNNSESSSIEAKYEDMSLPDEKVKTKEDNPSTTTETSVKEKISKTNQTESRNKETSILADLEPHQKEPQKTEVLDSSFLFPSLTKWEYSNKTVEKKPTKSNVKKIFNETLHAMVVRDGPTDLEKLNSNSEKNSKSNMTSQHRNKANLQDISLIFDTLASKLGISTGVNSKKSPFPSNRLKQSSRYDARNPVTSTFPPTTTPTTSTTPPTSSTTIKSDIADEYIEENNGFVPMFPVSDEEEEEEEEDVIHAEEPKEYEKEITNDSSSERIEGEAEVEVVDPNIYDEIFKHSQVLTSSTEPPTLMTLLPVKSNSGIRPLYTSNLGVHGGHDQTFKSFVNTNFREATVRDQISVTN